jgi:hypothetical protein
MADKINADTWWYPVPRYRQSMQDSTGILNTTA